MAEKIKIQLTPLGLVDLPQNFHNLPKGITNTNLNINCLGWTKWGGNKRIHKVNWDWDITLLHIEQGNSPFLPVAVRKLGGLPSPFSTFKGVPSLGSRITSFISPVSGFKTRVGLINCLIGRPASWSLMWRFFELGSRNLLLQTGHSWGCSPVQTDSCTHCLWPLLKINW